MDEKMNYAPKKSSIPQDIIFEIFSWLPVKLLMRLKCVSTLCNSIVSESNFLDIHQCRFRGTKFLLKGGEFYYTAEEKKDGKASASLLQVDRFNKSYNGAHIYYCFNSSVNGLFCGWRSSSLLIFNPSKKEVRFFPHPNKDIPWCNYSLGFEPKENKYKVVSTKYHAQEGYIKYWIFTLGIDKSWRETQRVFSCVPSSSPSVCISGVIYQFTYEPFINGYKSAIVAFDVKSENYEIIALWKAFLSRLHSYCHELIEVKDKLAVIDYNYVRRSGYMDMWILEKTPRKQWKRHIIRLPLIWNDKKPIFLSTCTPSDGEIVFVLYLSSGVVSSSGFMLFVLYDFTRKNWRELQIKGLPKENNINSIYRYVENLVSFG